MNINQLMKQAQQMQKNLAEAQNKLAETEFSGSSGNGMVKITINGKYDIKSLNIDSTLMIPDEADIVSDLIIAAYNDAKAKLEAKTAENMGGILPPGMSLPF